MKIMASVMAILPAGTPIRVLSAVLITRPPPCRQFDAGPVFLTPFFYRRAARIAAWMYYVAPLARRDSKSRRQE